MRAIYFERGRWFDGLSPYDDDKPLFKVEDQNYRLQDGVLMTGQDEAKKQFAAASKLDLTLADKSELERLRSAHG